MTSLVRSPTTHVLQWSTFLVALPSGRTFDLETRAPLAQATPRGACTLVRAGTRPLLVHENLREVKAVDLRTGEVVWTATTPWVSHLSVVYSNHAPIVTMQRVEKYGGGTRLYLDPETGRALEASELSAAIIAIDPQRILLGDVRAGAAFASRDDELIEVHRASDGVVLARFSSSKAATTSTTTVTASGARITEHTIDFSTPARRVFFGATEVLCVVSGGIVTIDVASGATQTLDVDADFAGSTVIDAQRQPSGAWHLLVRRANKTIDALASEGGRTRALWKDCGAIGFAGDRLINSELALGPITSGRYDDALRVEDATSGSSSERVAGPIRVERMLLETLVRIRHLSGEEQPLGLSVDALVAVERALNKKLPDWAVAVLAANSSVVSKKLGCSIDRLAVLDEEVRAVEKLVLERPLLFWEKAPEPFPARLVAMGCTKRRMEKRRDGRKHRYTITTYLCALDGEFVEVERWELEETPTVKGEVSAGLGHRRIAPSEALAELLGPLREKHLKAMFKESSGETLAREREDEAVAAVREIRLV